MARRCHTLAQLPVLAYALLFGNTAWASELVDKPSHTITDRVEQVHIVPAADGGLAVVFITKERGLSSQVYYGNPYLLGPDERMVAAGAALTYDSYSCPVPGNAFSNPRDLVDLVNTSKYMPPTSTAYFNPSSDAEALDQITEWGGCLGYTNPRAYYQAPYIHRAVLTHLQPNAGYWYKPDASSRSFGLTTPPGPGPLSGNHPSFGIGVWSNIGTTEVTLAVMKALKKKGPQLLLIPGGLAFADGLSQRWDVFGSFTEDLFATVPSLVTPGPREIAIGREQGIDMEMRYPMPFFASNSTSPYFFSYEAGPVHFLNIVGSYAASDPSSRQFQYISADLARVNRTLTPWVVVQFATPWYSSNTAHYQEGYEAQQNLEELFYEHSVDIVINGLVNSYERSHPVYKDQLDECGITYLVVGSGGSHEGLAAGSDGAWIDPKPAWSAFRQASWGFGFLTVMNGSHAAWEWSRVGCGMNLGGDGSVRFYPSGGKNCSTTGDNSTDKYEAFDRVMFSRKPSNCFLRKGIADSKASPQASSSSVQSLEQALSLANISTSASSKKPSLSKASARRLRETISVLPSVWQGHNPGRRREVDMTAITSAFGLKQRTSKIVRPAAASTLSGNEVRARLSELSSPADTRRRLQDDSGGPKQVHLGVAGPGSILVTFVSEEVNVSNRVYYYPFGSAEAPPYVVSGETHSYSILTCLKTTSSLFGPRLGPPEVVLTLEDLVPLLNSSRTLPASSNSYHYLSSPEDAATIIENNYGCFPWNGPNSYTNSPYIHTVLLTNLTPGVRYGYKPADGEKGFDFKALPAPGEWNASGEPFRLGVWADIGVTNVSFNVMKAMLSFDPDLLLLAGDLSYADGWGPVWDAFGEMTEPLMARVPSLTVPGNHEIDSGREQKKPWLHRYPGPFAAYFSESPSFFSYETGLLHIIGLSAPYVPSGPHSAQRMFLEEDLYRVDRAKTPWVIVFFHVPWYSSNMDKYQAGIEAQRNLEPILLRYGVDIVFSGHVHSYERSFPVASGSVDTCGITHIVVGDSGNLEGPAVGDGWKEPQPEWSAFREGSFGAGHLTVLNATHAIWDWQRVACVKTNGKAAKNSRSKKPYYTWDGVAGPPDGPLCETTSDESEQRFETSDRVVIERSLQCRVQYLDDSPLPEYSPPPAAVGQAYIGPFLREGKGPSPDVSNSTDNSTTTTSTVHRLNVIECTDFVPYPGYQGALNVTGAVALTDFNNFTQGVYWALEGVDPGCLMSGPRGQQCEISVHSGTSCDSVESIGDKYFNEDLLQLNDPWEEARYNSDEEGHSIESSGLEVTTGYSVNQLVGRVVIVYDSLFPGQRIACCVTAQAVPEHLQSLLGNETSNETSLVEALRQREVVRRPWWVVVLWCLAIALVCLLVGCALGTGGVEKEDEDSREDAAVKRRSSGRTRNGEGDSEYQPLNSPTSPGRDPEDGQGIEMSQLGPSSSKSKRSVQRAAGSDRRCFPKVCT